MRAQARRHHPLIRVLADAAAAACASSKCSRAARRYDIGSRQPRSALTPHEQAPHEHSVCQDLSRCPAAGDDHPRPAVCYVPLPSPANPSAPPPFRPSPLPSAAVLGPLKSPPRPDVRRHQLCNQPQFPIACLLAPAPFTTRDFVPGRFSDVEEPSRTQVVADVRETCTAADSF